MVNGPLAVRRVRDLLNCRCAQLAAGQCAPAAVAAARLRHGRTAIWSLDVSCMRRKEATCIHYF